MSGFEVRRASVDDWAALRDLRLEMLEDEPLAFLERLADARRVDDDGWRQRAVRHTTGPQVALVAIDDAGAIVGQMGGHDPDDRSGPWLVAVYVSPAWRGRARGVSAALLEGVEEWARERATILRLEVNERNPRAIAFYEARGFSRTGGRRPYPLDPTLDELEMVKRL